MTANVEPEEAQAILESMKSSGRQRAIADRDFNQPHRLSRTKLGSLRGTLLGALPELERFLSTILRGEPCLLDVTDVREVNADRLWDRPEFPLTMARFRVDGQPAWIVWQNEAAIAAIEKVFGASGDSEGARELSRVEKRVLLEVLSGVGRVISRMLGGEPGDFQVVDEVYAIGAWTDGPQGADSHRLAVSIALAGPIEESTFHVYLPGFQPISEDPLDRAPSVLPTHLEQVGMRVSAHLGQTEIPLRDLLGLEVGDVIPLGTPCDEPILVRVEDEVHATAHLGRSRGRLALRIEALNTPPTFHTEADADDASTPHD